MNELSWLIYAADVAGKAGFLFGFGGMLTGIGSAIAWGAYANYSGEARSSEISAKSSKTLDDFYRDSAEHEKSLAATAKRIALPATAISVVLVVSAVLVPGRETLYAIAASEMGERVIQSETGGKAINALNAWLDRQIDAPATEPTT